jgi:hypothetical protein
MRVRSAAALAITAAFAALAARHNRRAAAADHGSDDRRAPRSRMRDPDTQSGLGGRT